MTSATLTISAQPPRNVPTMSLPDRRARTPMTMPMSKNHAVASLKYHEPRGVPVRNALHAPEGSSADPPSLNRSMPKFCHGTKPTIMTTNVSANSTSTIFCLPVRTAENADPFPSPSVWPYSFSDSVCSCSDMKVEPLSAFTLRRSA